MSNRFVITDGMKSANILDSDDPTIWTYFSGQPRAESDALYAKVAAVFRAFNLKANTVGNMPFVLLRGEEEIDTSATWENKVGFMPNPSELFRIDTLSYMATNTVYNLRTSDILGYKTRNLINSVPYDYTPITDPVTGELLRIERWVGAEIEKYKPDDPRLVRMWRLDHTTEVLPSPNTEALAIMTAAGELHYADIWIENFYRRGGIKPTLIAMKGLVNPEKKTDEESKWSQWLRGIGKWWTNVARVYNAEALDVKAFGDGVADLENNEVYRQAIANIAMGTGMPLSLLLANSANYSTAKEEKATWYDNDVIPLCNWIAYGYNEQVFKPMGLRLEFRPETIDSQQEDETMRAGAISAFMDFFLKCPTYEICIGAASTFGYELTDDFIEAARVYFKDKEKRAKEMAENMQNVQNVQPDQQAPKPAAQPVPRATAPMPQPKAWSPSLDEFKEMEVWRDVALRKFKRGESLDFEYEPHYGGLPDSVTNDIKARLAEEREWDEERIKSAFKIAEIVAEDNAVKELAAALDKLAERM